jgi:hypothetical protein
VPTPRDPLVLAALLVAAAVSRVGGAHRLSDAEGAVDSAGATWTIVAEGVRLIERTSRSSSAIRAG